MNDWIKFTLWLVGTTFTIQTLAGTDAYVGASGDASCTHQSIQSAINDSNNYINIYIASGGHNDRLTYQENLSISRQIILHGGYYNCAEAMSNNLDPTDPLVYLQGTGNGSVVTINGSGSAVIKRFEITGGLGTSGGGIDSDNSKVRIESSFIHSNRSNSYGGGIYAIDSSGNDSELLLKDTLVVGNQALLGGGGIFCQNGQLLVDEFSGVSANSNSHSNADGGGLSLNSCDLDFYGGTKQTPNPVALYTYRGIQQNTTPRHGGGVYAINSSVKLLGSRYNGGIGNIYGRIDTPVNITANVADADQDNVGDGGGLYLKGSFLFPVSAEVHRGKINANTAHRGGAFYLGENTQLTLTRKRTQGQNQGEDPCWSTACSVISHNQASFKGGALYVEHGANVLINHSYINDNRADYGTVLYVDSTGSSNDIKFHQNLMVHNGRAGNGEFEDRYVIDLYNNSDTISGNNLSVELMHNTLVDNHATQAVFSLNGVNNYLGVFSSILHDPSSPRMGDLFGAFSSAEFDCVNVNETASIDTGYSVLTRANADDPGFVVRNYDYHLKPRSATVDFCDNSRIGSISETNDLDDHTRAVDDTDYQNLYGAWDLGSDEHAGVAQDNDVIFIDRFDW